MYAMKKIMIASLLFLGSFGVASAETCTNISPQYDFVFYSLDNVTWGGFGANSNILCPSDFTDLSFQYQEGQAILVALVKDSVYQNSPSVPGNTSYLMQFQRNDDESTTWWYLKSPSIFGDQIDLGSLQSAVGITTTNIVGFAAIPIALFVVFWIIGQLIGLFPGYKETVVKPQKVGKTIKL